MMNFRFREARSTVELTFTGNTLAIHVKDGEVTLAVYAFENKMSDRNYQILLNDCMNRLRRLGFKRTTFSIFLKIVGLTSKWSSANQTNDLI